MEGANVMQLCLKWNNFDCSVTSAFRAIHDAEELFDVTLATDGDGHQLKAHKLVLAACSPYFRDVFKNNPCDHPIIILREVQMVDLEHVLHFIYHGQVNVPHTSLAEFIRLAETLKIRGLTDTSAYREAQHTELQNHSFMRQDETTKKYKRMRGGSEAVSNKRACISSSGASGVPSVAVTGALHQPAPSSPQRCPSSQTPELKAEIQDMLEVKLEPGFSPDVANGSEGCVGGGDVCVVAPCEAAQCVSPPGTADGSAAPPPGATAPSSPNTSVDLASLDSAASSNVFILPRPLDVPSAQALHCLKSTANLQPEFPLDPASQNLPYPCPFCDKAYMSWGFRRRHIKGCHTKTPNLPCKWCLHVLPSRTHWETHVRIHHQLSESAARNGLLILEEAHMVLQFAAPTRISSLVELIKDKKTNSSESSNTSSTYKSSAVTTTANATTSTSSNKMIVSQKEKSSTSQAPVAEFVDSSSKETNVDATEKLNEGNSNAKSLNNPRT